MEQKDPKKFNLYKYVDKENIYPRLNGVLHKDGYKVATNGCILIRYKCDYPREYEGKVIGKNGKVVNDWFPNWKNAIPKDYKNYPIQIDLDTDKILKWRNEFKKDKRNIYIVKIGNTYFNLKLFALAAEFMKYFNIQRFYINGNNAACARSEKDFVIIMPYNFISGTKYSVKHIILKYN